MSSIKGFIAIKKYKGVVTDLSWLKANVLNFHVSIDDFFIAIKD